MTDDVDRLIRRHNSQVKREQRPPLSRHPRLAAIIVTALFGVLALMAAVGLYVDPRADGELHWPFTLGWVAWIVGFVVLEGVALARRPGGKAGGDTLSEHVWWLLRWPLVRLAAIGLWVWLTVHWFTPWA